MKRILLFAIMLTAVYACGDTKIAIDYDDNVKLGKAFNLKYSEKADVEKDMLTLKFIKVEESRCPKGVNCIRAGEGKVTLRATHAEESENIVLTAKGLCDEDQNKCGEIKNFRGFDIELISLSPYPTDGKKLTDASYVAKLKVIKGRM